MLALAAFGVGHLHRIFFVSWMFLQMCAGAISILGCQSTALPAGQGAGEPLRIVSLAPNITEWVAALGAEDRLVGVTRYCDEPASVKHLPKVGGYVDPSFEAVIALKPNLVISTGAEALAGFERRLEQAGVKVHRAPMDNMAGMLPAVRALGATLGAPDRAESALDVLSRQLNEASAAKTGGPLLVVYGARPLVVAGPHTFAHDLLLRIGATNAAGQAEVPYPVWALEQVVRAEAFGIIDARMEGDGLASLSEHLPGVPAVEHGRVCRLESTAALRPGPRLGVAAAEIAGCIKGWAAAHEAPLEIRAP